MRKVTALIVALFITVSATAFAAPNDNTDRGVRNPIVRIIRFIAHVFDVPAPLPPTP